MTPAQPEAQARKNIDEQLRLAGWEIQDLSEANLQAGRGVAIREFKMAKGHGFADYLLYVDGQPVGALEAKKEGETLRSFEVQAEQYSTGLPAALSAPIRPLPFIYLSTGVETVFFNCLDPQPRTREIFAPHRPETLAEWLQADSLKTWLDGRQPAHVVSLDSKLPSTLRSRLRAMPAPEIPGLWANKAKAIRGLESSLAQDRPRALIQMSTGSGKTLMSVVAMYRLIKFGGARRMLFLVDRSNLGIQAEGEFANYRTYDDHRKFNELYNVQRLTNNKIGASSKVVITTVQRLFSMLKGEPEFDPDLEQVSSFERAPGVSEARVEYNPAIPPEMFDFVFVDECHRSIYTLWRQVLEYFDAHLIGLTATPAKYTFGFFKQNLVMEYSREESIADGVNVDFDIYRIRTQITEHGSRIVAEPGIGVDIRDRMTRRKRWEIPDEDIKYEATQLDRDVVAPDQIRTIVQTFRDQFLPAAFPGRQHVPKTLIFAKNDSHAEDIVQIVREEFGKGNEFCKKITYKATGKSKDLIQEFRTSFYPRIAVTVDMIATGTDVKPLEVVVFMRAVKSRVLYEQMHGRGGRVIDKDDLKAVTPDATAKTHFVLVDCVGVTESKMLDTQPLDRKRTISFDKLLEHVSVGGTDPDMLSSLAARMARLERQLGEDDKARVREASGGVDLPQIAHGIVEALNPDRQVEAARTKFELAGDVEPTPQQVQEAAHVLLKDAVEILATRPKLRSTIKEIKQHFDQVIDDLSKDEVLEAGASVEAKEKARKLTQSFEAYLAANKDEIEALEFFYSQPYERRLRFKDIKALANAIGAPPRSWTPEQLWRAYEQLDKSRVRGVSGQRLLSDIVSLIRYALHQDNELVPYAEQVRERFDTWLVQQETAGQSFTDEQMRWLQMMRDHVGQSLEITTEDFDLTPFVQESGLGKAGQVFGRELASIVRELNEALAA